MKKISDAVRISIRNDREILGLSLYQLVEKYGFAKSSIFLIIRDCDDSNVRHAAPHRRAKIEDVKPVARPPLSKTDLGEATRQIICARLMLNGIKVFRPMTEDTPIDLLVVRENGSIAKCQCKYMFPGNGCHVMPLCSIRKDGVNSKAIRHIYTKEEVDFFLGYCCDNDSIYVVPFMECGGRQELHFWILRYPTSGVHKFDGTKFKNAISLLR
jgi:hypothetical protein